MIIYTAHIFTSQHPHGTQEMKEIKNSYCTSTHVTLSHEMPLKESFKNQDAVTRSYCGPGGCMFQ